MKISDVRAYTLSAKLDKPWKIADLVMKEMNATIVEVENEDGLIGYGEALTRLGPSATCEVVTSILKPVLLEADPMDVDVLWERMFATMKSRGHWKGFMIEAMSGVDIALWDLILKGKVSIIQPDIARCGGFTECRKIAALASAHGVPVAPHTGASGAISIAATLQFAASLSNFYMFEHMYTENPLREEILKEPVLGCEMGFISVPSGHGLGIEIDHEKLKRYM